MSYTILMPQFEEVTLDTNPINTDGLLKVSIKVTEQEITLSPEEKYSGEFYLAEV
ncbi:MAG: hypothetical protein IKI57_03610 [Clostridia bacterium]|nr:hypothetical protein [Clostridia bacterium]